MAEKEDTGDMYTAPSVSADQFMTEFNANSQIFGRLLAPWVNRIAAGIPKIYQQNTRFTYLNNYVGRMRDKLTYWESELDDALADRATADELTGDAQSGQQSSTSNNRMGGDRED